jgi:hypothetical protein
VINTHLAPKTRFMLLSDSRGFVDVGRLLWWEECSVVYNCCWSSPAQSFSSPSPAGLVTIFYCLRFETPPTWMTRFPNLYIPGTGWPSYTYPQVLGSFFVVSYDSHGYGGGIRTPLNAGELLHAWRQIYMSVYIYIYIYIHFFFHWLYSPLWPWPLLFGFMINLQIIGLLRRVMSSSQGLYLNTE